MSDKEISKDEDAPPSQSQQEPPPLRPANINSSVRRILKKSQLDRYSEILASNGYDSTAALSVATKEDLLMCGILRGHAGLIVHEANYMKKKTSENGTTGMEPFEVDTAVENKSKKYREDDSISDDSDENIGRGNWSKQVDFLLSCIGYAVGLGNIWRFPYLCYANGGGAFLIPYTIMLFLAGIPLFFMELAFGQFASEGPTTVWQICPLFKGVGYSMVVISCIVTIYYNVIICYSVYYMFASFADVLPWVGCHNTWNTEDCGYPPVPNGTVLNGQWIPQDILDTMNVTLNETVKRQTPSEEFFTYEVLRLSDGLDDLGPVRWQIALSLLFAWTVVFLCLLKGVKSSGKVVYFTATFPYLVLIILFIRGVTLPGAGEGIKFYMKPKWTTLKNARVWKDAASQIFYSLGPAWGGLLTMASYNKFHNNCFRDALMIPLINCSTSVFAGFVVFSVIGFMAHELNTPVDKVVEQGAGLLFVVYPEVVSRLPVSQIWSILFFFMVFTLGLDTQFTMVETVISSLMDEFPSLRRRKSVWVFIICLVLFLLGLPMVTEGGMYLLQIMDWYSAGISLMLVSVFECIVIMGIYGVGRFWKDIEMMLGFRPILWPYFTVCWCFFTPAIILFIIIFGLVDYTPVYYGSYTYPEWGEIIGWLTAAASIAMIPLFMIVQYCFVAKGDNFLEKMKFLLSPTAKWGPALPKHRTGIYALKSMSYSEKDTIPASSAL
ncbi:sodium- and chloride-dependent glycine transporter 1-like [Ptychodera flava]|uniref:sodium- and chloride-dependent glycine transporter 1-like n=1 Tax=Ptychodera flava TaxID=63121 RepID=UPI00396A9440